METLLNYCENSKDHAVTPNEFMWMKRVRMEESHWIPCSKRLPEENTDILVTYVDGEEARIIPVNYGRGTWFDCIFNSALDSLKVIAWMPLPEPYREVE